MVRITAILAVTVFLACGRLLCAAEANDETNVVAEFVEVLNDTNTTVAVFRTKARAVIQGKKLLGLTAGEVKKKLGEPHFVDWFVNLGKPRFMGDRWSWTSWQHQSTNMTSVHFAVFIKEKKVYSCAMWVRLNKELIEHCQEAEGPPVRWTWN